MKEFIKRHPVVSTLIVATVVVVVPLALLAIFWAFRTHSSVQGYAAKDWRENKMSSIIEEYYGANIVDDKTELMSDYLEFQTRFGWNFYYYCSGKIFSTSGISCGYLLDKNDEQHEVVTFGDLLYQNNRDKIHSLVTQYNGKFIEDNTSYVVLTFGDYSDQYDFARAVQDLAQIQPAKAACEENSGDEYNSRRNCELLTPVYITNSLNVGLEQWSWATVSDVFNF